MLKVPRPATVNNITILNQIFFCFIQFSSYKREVKCIKYCGQRWKIKYYGKKKILYKNLVMISSVKMCENK